MNLQALKIALISLLAVGQPQLVAQEIAPGSEVRLLVTPSHDIRGSLLEWDADTLRLEDPGSGFVHTVPNFEIERLRVSEPRSRGQGAVRGLLIGSVVGALSVGTLGAATSCEGSFCFSKGQVFMLGAMLGGVGGGGIGTAVGAAWPGKRWVDVPIER